MVYNKEFEKTEEILNHIDDIEVVKKVIDDNLISLGYPSLLTQVPFEVIAALAFIVNTYINVKETLISIIIKDEHKETKKKIMVLNDILKSSPINKLNTDKHILTEYYLILNMLIIMSKDKFNECLLSYLEHNEKNTNENEYLKVAEFSKKMNGLKDKIIYCFEKKFTKVIYSRVIHEEEQDYLYIWLTTSEKEN